MEFELAQKSVNEIEKNYSTSGKMKDLCKRVIAEGCVLLENDGVLPLLNKKISLFGRCQINTFYAGYGSGGDVKSPYKVSILEGLLNNNANINKTVMEEYLAWTKDNVPYEGTWGNWPLCFPEMPVSVEFVKEASKESDVAVVVIGRSAGEDRDIRLEKGSWFLNDEEKELLRIVRDCFKMVCIIINSGSIMDITELLEYKPNALMYVWQGGQEMGNAVAEVLLGKVSPSGKLTDTIAKIEDYPSFNCFGDPDFNEYREDIYVGYRYFNTFCKDKIIYPFGYGLTYSKFALKLLEITNKDTIINAKIKIKNVGKYPSKEVVQIYLSKPLGKLGNPNVELIAYKKANCLKPDEEQVLEFNIDIKKYASYDDNGATGNINHFILENGSYSIFMGFNSLELTKIHNFSLDEDLLVKKTMEACAPKVLFKRMINRNGISFEDVLVGIADVKERILRYIPNNEELVYKYYTYQQLKDNEVSLDDFVNSLDLEELEALTRGSLYSMNSPYGPLGNAGTLGASNEKLFKRGIPAISTNDGPSGVRLACHSTQVPNGIVLASTFNDELIEQLAYEIGSEDFERKSHILLAPGINIHRSPLCGRNFEYYSEDPYLTGKIAAAYVRGVQTAGTSACPKHFACNSQEFQRHVNDSRLSQRALREIYLKGFEICIEESNPNVIMTSYNKINGEYAYYNHDLVRIILREEFKFKGLVITDWWMRPGESPLFENVIGHGYRVRATVDVFMPGSRGSREEPGESDGTLLSSLENKGITLSEVRYCAKQVIRFSLEHIK